MLCVRELFICVFDTTSSESTQITGETQSPPLITNNSSIANTQLNLLESRRLSILSNQGIYDEVFVANETLFSQRQVETVDLKGKRDQRFLKIRLCKICKQQ